MIRSDTFAVAVLILFAWILMIPALWIGHIVGHSSFLNVSWGAEFAASLAAGEFWPRWLPGMNGGRGSAVFYFYGPLPFYITAPFFALVDERIAPLLGSATLLGLSGLACFLLTRHYVATGAALGAAALYMVMPYHYHADVWVRTAYGEQAAFIFIPLCCWCTLSLNKSWRYAVGLAFSYAGLVLSHIPSALLFAPFLVAFCLFVTAAGGLITLVRSAAAGLLSLGLSAAYLIPVYYGREYIQPEFWSVYEASEHVIMGQRPSSILPFLLLSVGFSATMLVVSSLAARQSIEVRIWAAWVPWLVAGAVVLFIVSPLSIPLWDRAGLLKTIQFPWRALVILDLIASVGFGLVLGSAVLTRKLIATAGACVTLSGASWVLYTVVANEVVRPQALESTLIVTRTGAAEYLPACLSVKAITEDQLRVLAEVQERASAATGQGLLPVFYYPFLKGYVDGQEVPISCDPNSGLIRANAEGPITLQHHLLAEEKVGIVITLMSLIIALTVGLTAPYRRVPPGPLTADLLTGDEAAPKPEHP